MRNPGVESTRRRAWPRKQLGHNREASALRCWPGLPFLTRISLKVEDRKRSSTKFLQTLKTSGCQIPFSRFPSLLSRSKGLRNKETGWGTVTHYHHTKCSDHLRMLFKRLGALPRRRGWNAIVQLDLFMQWTYSSSLCLSRGGEEHWKEKAGQKELLAEKHPTLLVLAWQEHMPPRCPVSVWKGSQTWAMWTGPHSRVVSWVKRPWQQETITVSAKRWRKGVVVS